MFTWVGIIICLAQSAILSGLNLAVFSMSKLELEVEARKRNPDALKTLQFRKNANFTLVTILWGNVGVNVLLAILSGSVMAGFAAFLFSTVVITVFAEIMPQAYFSRHAMRMTAFLAPILHIYQVLLYPVAWPTAWALNKWLGGEIVRFFRERDLRQVIQLHMESSDSDIAWMEGQGALNFLNIDDVPLNDEGEDIDPDSIIQLEFKGRYPQFPPIQPDSADSFLRKIAETCKSWIIIIDSTNEPRLVLSANDFIRNALFTAKTFNPHKHCHKPIIIDDSNQKLGVLMPRFRLKSNSEGQDIIEDDVILLWSKTPKIITGQDIFGRLMRGIARER